MLKPSTHGFNPGLKEAVAMSWGGFDVAMATTVGFEISVSNFRLGNLAPLERWRDQSS